MPVPLSGCRGVSTRATLGQQVPGFSPGRLSKEVRFPQAFSQTRLLPCRVHILLPRATDTPGLSPLVKDGCIASHHSGCDVEIISMLYIILFPMPCRIFDDDGLPQAGRCGNGSRERRCSHMSAPSPASAMLPHWPLGNEMD